MSFKITANGSTDAPFTPTESHSLTRDSETCSTAELTSLAAMPAIAAAGAAAASAACAISPSRIQTGIPLKFQLLSRKLLELGYCQFEIPHSLRYIIANILKQLEGATSDATTKMFLQDFIKKIESEEDKKSITDIEVAEAVERFVTSPEIAAHFDCSSIHHYQREQIKTSLLKGAELLAQLVFYWDSPLEAALQEHLPEKDSLKAVSRLLIERDMFSGYITTLGEKTAQKLSIFAAQNRLIKDEYSKILQLIIDVLIDDPSIELHESQMSSKLQRSIRTILEPYHASKKIKNGLHILGPSIDTYFYKCLINTSPMRESHREPQGHIPTLLHAFLDRCKFVTDKLDSFEIKVALNKRLVARERVITSVDGGSLTKLTEQALQNQLAKQFRKVDELASGLTDLFHHLSLLKNMNRRLDEHITRHIPIDPSFIRISRQLLNRAKAETIEIHNLLTIELNRNLISHQALSDEEILPEKPLKDTSESFSLLSTPAMNHGATAPQLLPSMEKKMEFRRSILDGKKEPDISKLLGNLERNMAVLNNLQSEAESVIHMSKAIEYLLGSDEKIMEKHLLRESAAYEERFASLQDEIDPPGAKLSLLFRAAERTFIATPPRPSSETDRAITPSPPLLPSAGGFISSPTLTGYTPSEGVIPGSPPRLTCAKRLTYEELPFAVDPPPESAFVPSGLSGSIASLITQMLMIRSSTVVKGSVLREESTSHIVLAGQDMEQLIKAIQTKDLPLFRASASLLMIDTHVAIEQYLKAELVGTATDLTEHSLVSLQAMLGGKIPSEFNSLLEESDLSIIWARYPEKAVQVHGHKRRKPRLIQYIERLSSLEGFETTRDQTSASTILFQSKEILTQATALVLGKEAGSTLEALLATPVASYIPFPSRKQNCIDISIAAVKETLQEIFERSDLDHITLTSLKEVTHYVNWIEAAENMIQFDSDKSSSYWIMRLFIGGVDKLFENLYIGAASAHGIGEIRSHNLLSLRKLLFSSSIKSTLSEQEVHHIAGFNIGNGLQYPHQQQNARTTILLKALNYSLSHIGVEEGFSPARAQIMSEWQLTLEAQVEIALSIWVKEARSLFQSEGGAGVAGSAAASSDS